MSGTEQDRALNPMRCSEPGHRASVAIQASRGPGRYIGSLDAIPMRVVLIILLFVVQSFAGESSAPALFRLADVLPSGRCEIELMTIQFSERAKELTLKWQTAIATNQDWFLEEVKQ